MMERICSLIVFSLISLQSVKAQRTEEIFNETLPLTFSTGPAPLVCARAFEIPQDVQRDPGSVATMPEPHRVYCDWEEGEICTSEEFERFGGGINMGQDMELHLESFTIFAHIRLRPRNPEDNWGGRIISKRTSNKRGWQFVVPSYYGRKISLYTNDRPGHITYGEKVVPNYEWFTTAITVDRDTYRSEGLAIVQAYYNGIPDGAPYILRMEGTLATDAPVTIGNWIYEDNTYHQGRKDWRSASRRRHLHQFYGDIRDLSVWREKLSSEHLLSYSEQTVIKNGMFPKCQPGWRSHQCKCYKIFSTPLNYDSAWQKCDEQEGRLAVVDSQEVQDFVWGLIVPEVDSVYWIGLNDSLSENIWRFSNGYNLNYFIGQWNNFPGGFPGKEYRTDDCAEIRKSLAGKWNDANCNKFNPYVCEQGPGIC